MARYVLLARQHNFTCQRRAQGMTTRQTSLLVATGSMVSRYQRVALAGPWDHKPQFPYWLVGGSPCKRRSYGLVEKVDVDGEMLEEVIRNLEGDGLGLVRQ